MNNFVDTNTFCQVQLGDTWSSFMRSVYATEAQT